MSPEIVTILVADDTPSNIQLLDEILGSEYELLAAANGQEALETALQERPCLILMDVMMPVMAVSYTHLTLPTSDLV